MKFKELLANMNKLAEENPELLNLEVVQQDCFSAPNAYSGTNVYVGHFYETEDGEGFLNPKDTEDEIAENYPVIVIESF